jgi:hypothetical protein
MDAIQDRTTLQKVVSEKVSSQLAFDIHTHLYSAEFGDLVLRGLEDLLTYHYLQAELNRVTEGRSPRDLMRVPKAEQARLVWQELFEKRSPISEATRGVVTSLRRMGVTDVRSYETARAELSRLSTAEHIDRSFSAAHVSTVVMTNDPFSSAEAAVWQSDKKVDPRFRAALRIDDILINWSSTWPLIKKQGYDVEQHLTGRTLPEVARFLEDWAHRMNAVYMAVSLPDSFRMPDPSSIGVLLAECVVPACRRLDIPFAMMIGVRRRVFPELADAGDALKRSDLDSVTYLCRTYPRNRFMLTVLSRENQHEAAAIARKCRNLHIFGCWWFNNNPSIIEEITRERIEMLGTSVTPIHSDARILDQMVYKWTHSRRIVAAVLTEKYGYLIDEGWYPTTDEIERDAAMLFGGEFQRFLKAKV